MICEVTVVMVSVIVGESGVVVLPVNVPFSYDFVK